MYLPAFSKVQKSFIAYLFFIVLKKLVVKGRSVCPDAGKIDFTNERTAAQICKITARPAVRDNQGYSSEESPCLPRNTQQLGF